VSRLRHLCADPRVDFAGDVGSLAQLFERIPGSYGEGEAERLTRLYRATLEPLVVRNFERYQQIYLKQQLKILIVLRLLDVPYRPLTNDEDFACYQTIASACNEEGLKIWREGDACYVVVESSVHAYATWIVRRSLKLIGREEREKVVSDALWSHFFTTGNPPRTEITLLDEEPSRCMIDGTAYSGREGIVLRCEGAAPWVIAFASPWKEDRGQRVCGVLSALPPEVPLGRVAVWEPRFLTSPERDDLLHYGAAARALRLALARDRRSPPHAHLIDILRKEYLTAAPGALRTLLACYREGRLITDCGVIEPRQETRELAHTLTCLGLMVRAPGCRGPET
jgi:hypothetical protein